MGAHLGTNSSSLHLRLGILEEQPVRVNGIVTVRQQLFASESTLPQCARMEVGYEPESSTPEVPLLQAGC